MELEIAAGAGGSPTKGERSGRSSQACATNWWSAAIGRTCIARARPVLCARMMHP